MSTTLLMSERDLQSSCIEIAKLYGWRVAHQRPARTAQDWRTAVEGHAGLPDLILARGSRNGRPARLLFVELKAARGRLSLDQKLWLEVLIQVEGVDVRLWTPNDLYDGRIEAALR